MIGKNYKFCEKKLLQSTISIVPGIIKSGDALGIESFLRAESTHFIVTDENIANLYLNDVKSTLRRNGKNVVALIVPANEGSKSLECYTKLVESALNHNFDKHSYIISLGGGVVNNLAGFLASTLYRGIGLIHIPTSLLSQVDASISFKQAINSAHGKNLIGSLYCPQYIVVDPTVLLTLDERFIKDGLAESIKHALCHDFNFYNYIIDNKDNLSTISFLTAIVTRSIELKLEVIEGDVVPCATDFNESIKHYGHALGHAIEHLSMGKLYHGEAIAIGMCITAEVALLLGVSDESCLKAHYEIFETVGLPSRVPEYIENYKIINKLIYDKHYLNGKSYLGLVKTIGKVASVDHEHFGHYVAESVISAAIDSNRTRFK